GCPIEEGNHSIQCGTHHFGVRVQEQNIPSAAMLKTQVIGPPESQIFQGLNESDLGKQPAHELGGPIVGSVVHHHDFKFQVGCLRINAGNAWGYEVHRIPIDDNNGEIHGLR